MINTLVLPNLVDKTISLSTRRPTVDKFQKQFPYLMVGRKMMEATGVTGRSSVFRISCPVCLFPWSRMRNTVLGIPNLSVCRRSTTSPLTTLLTVSINTTVDAPHSCVPYPHTQKTQVSRNLLFRVSLEFPHPRTREVEIGS